MHGLTMDIYEYYNTVSEDQNAVLSLFCIFCISSPPCLIQCIHCRTEWPNTLKNDMLFCTSYVLRLLKGSDVRVLWRFTVNISLAASVNWNSIWWENKNVPETDRAQQHRPKVVYMYFEYITTTTTISSPEAVCKVAASETCFMQA